MAAGWQRLAGMGAAAQLMLSQGHQHWLYPPRPQLHQSCMHKTMVLWTFFIWDFILHNLKTTDLIAPAIGEVSSDPFEAELCIFAARRESLSSGERENTC